MKKTSSRKVLDAKKALEEPGGAPNPATADNPPPGSDAEVAAEAEIEKLDLETRISGERTSASRALYVAAAPTSLPLHHSMRRAFENVARARKVEKHLQFYAPVASRSTRLSCSVAPPPRACVVG